MTPEPLAVFIGGRYAGQIDYAARRLRLVYEPDYATSATAVPLSLSLPLGAGEIRGARVAGWLDGLLPGNEHVRRDWAGRRAARSVAPFDLLSTPIGLDCPGAVQTCPVTKAAAITQDMGGVDWLRAGHFSGIIEEIVRDQRWARQHLRGGYSLAGAQGKTALCREGDRWGEPWGVTPSTHILKPSMRDLPDQALNEHLCLSAARYCGLVAAHSDALRVGEHIVVAVARYDRVVTEDGTVRRVHQEDFHQACGVPSESIYQSEGRGHTLRRLARLLADYSADPHTDRQRFFDALVYNWVVCNTDAHTKNYSLLIGPRGVARLAPLYDIWSYKPYDPQYIRSHAMAMSAVEDKRIFAAEDPAMWRATARAIGVDTNDAPERAAMIASLVPAAFQRALDELPEDLRTASSAVGLTSHMETRGAECKAALTRTSVSYQAPTAAHARTTQPRPSDIPL